MRFGLVSLTFALAISGCTITRYYKTSDIQGQIGSLTNQIDTQIARMKADYEEKELFYKGLQSTGARADNSPIGDLEKLLREMASERHAAQARASKIRDESSAVSQSLAGKDRIMSDQPEYERVSAFGKRSDSIRDELNGAFAGYTAKSNAFSKRAQDSKVFPVDVANYEGQLKSVMSEIERQSRAVEAKIAEYEKLVSQSGVAKRDERLALLRAMSGDVQKILATREELETFRKSFMKLAKGKKTLIVGPHLPNYEFFSSLNPVQDRLNASVTSFNQKVDTYNQL